MPHPYKHLPDHAFWRKAVAEVSEVDPVVSAPFRIGPQDKVGTAGSCFAQHIARHLKRHGFNYFTTEPPHELMSEKVASAFNYGTFSARYGNIYTTRQLLQLCRRAFGQYEPAEALWRTRDGWIDPFRPQIQPYGFISEAELLADREQHLAAVRRLLTEVDVFVFTLGLTECWVSNEDGAVFPVCPGVSGGSFDPKLYSFKNLTVGEVEADLNAFLDFLASINKPARVILTVSPVPLTATAVPDQHVLVSTIHSKSVLRVVAGQVAARRENVTYFPSYEIITGPAARGRYFAEDLRSVTEMGVEHVMRSFIRNYTSAAADLPLAPAKPETSYLSDMGRAVEVNCEEEALDQSAKELDDVEEVISSNLSVSGIAPIKRSRLVDGLRQSFKEVASRYRSWCS